MQLKKNAIKCLEFMIENNYPISENIKHFACRINKLDILKFTVENQNKLKKVYGISEIGIKTICETEPIFICCRHGSLDCLKYLKSIGQFTKHHHNSMHKTAKTFQQYYIMEYLESLDYSLRTIS